MGRYDLEETKDLAVDTTGATHVIMVLPGDASTGTGHIPRYSPHILALQTTATHAVNEWHPGPNLTGVFLTITEGRKTTLQEKYLKRGHVLENRGIVPFREQLSGPSR